MVVVGRVHVRILVESLHLLRLLEFLSGRAASVRFKHGPVLLLEFHVLLVVYVVAASSHDHGG